MSRYYLHTPFLKVLKGAGLADQGKTRPGIAALLERLTAAIIGAVLGTAVFAFLAHEVYEGETRAIDGAVYRYFTVHQIPTLHTLMQGLSLLASGYALILIALACSVLIWRTPAARLNALSLLLAIGGGEALVNSLKLLFHRARPAPIFAHFGYSFPSGHAFFAVTVYGLIAYWLTRSPKRNYIWLLTAVFIALIGFSRVYLGVHYASDVLAGFAVGIPWLWACLALPNALRQTKNTADTKNKSRRGRQIV